jgi:hypothetical protein
MRTSVGVDGSCRRFRTPALAWFFVAAASLGAAENNGVVRFAGLPLPGATITASQADKQFTAISDSQGAYSLDDLTDGVWTIRVEMLCFAPMVREVTVAPNARRQEWEMKLLPPDQIQALLEPPAPAPASFQLATLQLSADAANIVDEPSALSAAELSEAPSEGLLISGSVNNARASPFAQPAAFGNARPVFRSLYTGSLGWIVGHSALDARSFSLTGQATPKPAYSRVQGVASFGGPLRIPRILERGGPNVTISYQRVRNRNAISKAGLMPNAAVRSGDFSNLVGTSGKAVTIYDPTTSLPFPGNVIPQERISSQARALLDLYPLPDFQRNTRYNYQIPLVSDAHQDSLQARVNRSLGRKEQVSGRFALQSSRTSSANLFGFLDTGDGLGLDASVTWTHTFTPRVNMTLGYLFSRQSSSITPYFANRRNVSGEAGITGNNQNPANWGSPNLQFMSGITGLVAAQRSVNHDQTSAISGSLSWLHTRHTLKVGGDFRRQQFNLLAQENARGAFTFTGAAASTTTGGVVAIDTWSDFAGFLLGIPDASSIAFGNADKYFRSTGYDAFVNDVWKVNSALSVNAGVRWEYNSPVTEVYGRLVNLDIAPGYRAVEPVVAQQRRGALTGRIYPDSLIQPDRHAFQPRLAVAWRPLPRSTIVVRAGYGVYYDTSPYWAVAIRMAQQSPLSKSLSAQNTTENPLTLADGFRAGKSTPNTYAVDPNLRVGYAQNWSVAVQRDLTFGMVVTATYIGTKGTHGQQQILPNTYPLNAANPCSSCPGGYIYLTSGGNSIRHAGQLQLRRRLRSGFTAQLEYTFAKSIDNATMGQGSAFIAQNWLDLRAERGRSSFDQRHLLSVQFQYTSGMGLHGGALVGAWMGRAFKDWSFVTQMNAGSGLPLTPIYPAAVPGTGVTGSMRPDYTGLPLYAAPEGLSLNPAAVTAPVAGQWGNAGRNSITGPSQFNLNASISRTFRLSDRLNADLRVDATNALNHVSFRSWNVVAGSAQFGLPDVVNPMRSLQTSLRVRF